MMGNGRFIKDLLVDDIDVSECLSDESPVVGDDDKVLSDDDEQYSTMTVEYDQVGGIYGCPELDRKVITTNSNGVPTNIVVAHASSDSILQYMQLVFTTIMFKHFFIHFIQMQKNLAIIF